MDYSAPIVLSPLLIPLFIFVGVAFAALLVIFAGKDTPFVFHPFCSRCGCDMEQVTMDLDKVYDKDTGDEYQWQEVLWQCSKFNSTKSLYEHNSYEMGPMTKTKTGRKGNCG